MMSLFLESELNLLASCDGNDEFVDVSPKKTVEFTRIIKVEKRKIRTRNLLSHLIPHEGILTS